MNKFSEFQDKVSNFDEILSCPRLFKIGLFFYKFWKSYARSGKSESTPRILIIFLQNEVLGIDDIGDNTSIPIYLHTRRYRRLDALHSESI